MRFTARTRIKAGMMDLGEGERQRNGGIAWKAFLAAALMFHAVLSFTLPDRGWTTSAGTGLVSFLAFAFCLFRARHADNEMRWRWWMLASAFALWIAAYAMIAYLQCIVRPDPSRVHFDALLYTLRGVPFLLLLAQLGTIDSGRSFRTIDGAQALLFAGLAIVLLFPAVVHAHELFLPFVTDSTMLTYHDVQNIGLALLSILGLEAQPSPARRSFAQALCTLLVVYAATSAVVNHFVIEALSPPPGAPSNIAGDMPAAAFILVALRGETGLTAARAGGRYRMLLSLVMPATFCAASIAAAFAVAEQYPAIGLIGAFLAILLYATRTALIQFRLIEMRIELGRANDRLEVLAASDALTGLSNRRAFDERLVAEWRRATRSGQCLAVLLIDIDSFKAYNDTAGHPAGDACLRSVATILQRCVLREGDLLARYGGEEFAVIAQVAAAAAAVLAERLRRAVEEAKLPHPGIATNLVTISIGVAVAAPDATAEDPIHIVDSADLALYRAKASGKNCVECARAAVPIKAEHPLIGP